ncbi:hypothetical protein BDZ89DRAFT_1082360 [Hymenopellis radicata]|nr:hypothetical protein BDZ89DRAFT_1082360 [Hymenopellis radicata]
MAVGDLEKGFGSIASSGCLVLVAVPMFAVVVGAICCLFGGAIACGHRILQDGFVNDPRFSAPILSSFVAGILGGMLIIIIPCAIFIGMKGGWEARSGSEAAPLTVPDILLKRVFPSVPLSVAAAGAVGAAILRHGGDMAVLAPGWAAVCGLLGSAVISTAVAILGMIVISCCLCAGVRLLDV